MLEVNNDSIVDSEVEKGLDALVQQESAANEYAEPAVASGLLTGLILTAVDLLPLTSDANSHQQVYSRILRYSIMKKKVLERDVYLLPFFRVVEQAVVSSACQKSVSSTKKAIAITLGKWHSSLLHAHKDYDLPWDEEAERPLLVKDFVTNTLVGDSENRFAGGLYLNEVMVERLRKVPPGKYTFAVYKTLINVNAIQPYPDGYHSNVADFFKYGPRHYGRKSCQEQKE